MGTWGVGVFSDDTAADVRNEYRSYLAQGIDGVAATDKVLASFDDSQDDMDDGPPFWLSLAATQFRYGRLEDRVRDRALKAIDDGTDLVRFSATPKLVRARERVLKKLRAQLVGPQREAVKVRPEVRGECDWKPGEIIGFQRNSGEWILLHVQGIGENRRRSRYPIVCVLDAPFARVASVTVDTPVRRVSHLPLHMRSRRPDAPDLRFGPCPDCFAIFLKKRDLNSHRVAHTGVTIQPKLEVKGEGILPGMTCFAWKVLDDFLDNHLEPSDTPQWQQLDL